MIVVMSWIILNGFINIDQMKRLFGWSIPMMRMGGGWILDGRWVPTEVISTAEAFEETGLMWSSVFTGHGECFFHGSAFPLVPTMQRFGILFEDENGDLDVTDTPTSNEMQWQLRVGTATSSIGIGLQ